MKTKLAIFLSAVVIFLLGIVVWYNVPIDLMDVDTNEVMEIVVFNGNEADDWNNFIINSDDTIRKDPFFYSVTKGNVDYNYIESIVE